MVKLKRVLQRLHSDEGGQVMWLFSMTILVLVVLAVMVANTGRQVARKIRMQNAADAAAVSSAIWMARGMNVISMNNVAMTETLGLIANLRAMHIAWQVNQVALVAEYYVAQGLISSIFLAPAGVLLMVAVGLGWIPTCAIEGIDGYACEPPTGMTFSGPDDGIYESLAHPTSGTLWDFMSVLDQANSVVSVAAPLLAFAEAYNIGTENIKAAPNETQIALMMPSFGNGMLQGDANSPKTPVGGEFTLPVKRGQFEELCEPTRSGTLLEKSATPVKTYGYEPLKYRTALGLFTKRYEERGKGPFEVYKDDFNRLWWPSAITFMPAGIYRALANISMSALCGGDPPPIRPMETRIAPYDKARATLGAHDFMFIQTFVQSNYARPSQIPFCEGNHTTDSGCFEPNNKSQLNDPLDQLKDKIKNAGKGATEDDLKKMQDARSVKPTFDPPVDNSSYSVYGPLKRQLADLPKYPTCGPKGPVAQVGGANWCRLPGQDVWEQIIMTCKNNCPKNDPKPGETPTKPPGPPEYVYQDSRLIFQYASVSQDIDPRARPGGLSTTGGDKPQPMHIDLGDGNLTEHPDELTTAIERMQFLAVAYRGTALAPLWGGATVTVRDRRSPIFHNPNSLGLLTYAQAQTYNPTSWDLYTQDWHAKLVPADMLERDIGTFGVAPIEKLMQMVKPTGSLFNAH